MKIAFLLAVLLAISVEFSNAGNTVIVVNQPGFTPEGIAWSSSLNRFICSSGLGSLYTVDDTGNIAVFGSAPNFVFPAGVEVDEAKGLVYAANVNFTAVTTQSFNGFLTSVATFHLSNGSLVREVDLSTVGGAGVGHFANDVTVDENGNLYVTDSLGSQIWKVTPTGTPSVLVHDNRFAGAGDLPLGLNGIVYHSGGFLLTSKSYDAGVNGYSSENYSK